MSMASTAVFILAGGAGTRFWPLSRASRPKQFLPLGKTNESLITATARRIKTLSGSPQIYVVTNRSVVGEVQRHVPEATILAEPIGRNTAASIGFAAVVAAARDPETVIVILPADHAVRDEARLCHVLERAVTIAAQHELLVTVGISPTFAHTGYGYVQRGEPLKGHDRSFQVKHFYEKPNLERALSYCEAGDFYWNSGMFIFRAGVVLRAIAECLPAMHAGLLTIQKALNTPRAEAVLEEVFPTLESISIDVGVLEHVKNRAVVEAEDFGWNDVGSWDAWASQFPPDAQGNLCVGDVIAVESSQCIVRAEAGAKRSIALLGVKDLVVIDSGDALLICPRERVQDVKKVVDVLKQKGRGELI